VVTAVHPDSRERIWGEGAGGRFQSERAGVAGALCSGLYTGIVMAIGVGEKPTGPAEPCLDEFARRHDLRLQIVVTEPRQVRVRGGV